MSVLTRSPTGEITLSSKGADEMIMARLKKGHQGSHTLQEQVNLFSKEGLRTLVVARRDIQEEELEAFLQEYEAAAMSLTDRAGMIAAACEKMEVALDLVGCTAVEDRLQDQAPETIEFLKSAGINFWLLTGDKKDTAISIGVACNILKIENGNIFIVGQSLEEVSQSIEEQSVKTAREGGAGEAERALVIEGSALVHALTDTLGDQFLALAQSCATVLCCRVSPLQKAQVVQLVQVKTKKICLGVGDGANDVSMIQMANVGVGIIGKEGTQATRASDYALPDFKGLRRLLAVHGRYSYLRLTELILFSFYKNIAFIMVVFWFGFQSAWSGKSIYEDSIMACFNLFFTSLPPLFLGIFEKDIEDRHALAFPKLYQTVQQGLYYNPKTIFAWSVAGLWHSLVVYYSLYFMFGLEELVDFRTMSLTFSTTIILLVLCKVSLITRYWTFVTVTGIILSIVLYLLLMAGIVYVGFFYGGAGGVMFSDPRLYLALAFVIVTSLLPDYSLKFYLRQTRPADWQIIQETFSKQRNPTDEEEEGLLNSVRGRKYGTS